VNTKLGGHASSTYIIPLILF